MKIKIHYSFLVLLIIFLYAGFLKEFMILFLSIILHEFGHFVVMKLCKEHPTEILITSFGGMMKMRLKTSNSFKILAIYLSGVFINFLIIQFSHLLDSYQTIIYQYNLLLIVFNLLPIYPLDGYFILQELVGFFPNKRKAFVLTYVISITTLACLFVYALTIGSLGIVIIFSFLLYKNVQLYSWRDTIILKKLVKRSSLRYNY